MNFDLKVPVCPVCSEELRGYFHSRPDQENSDSKLVHIQSLTFQCNAQFTRKAERNGRAPSKILGVWERWEAKESCSKAQDVALRLLAEKNVVRSDKAEF